MTVLDSAPCSAPHLACLISPHQPNLGMDLGARCDARASSKLGTACGSVAARSTAEQSGAARLRQDQHVPARPRDLIQAHQLHPHQSARPSRTGSNYRWRGGAASLRCRRHDAARRRSGWHGPTENIVGSRSTRLSKEYRLQSTTVSADTVTNTKAG